jgi:hypothetical protein
MRKLMPAVVLALVPSLAFGDATSDFTSTHPRAMALIQFPPDIKSFAKVCERQVEAVSVSFWGTSGKAALWVTSKQPIVDLRKVVSLQVLFNPMPTALPGPNASLDWGYVFDRNQDGKVDYVAFLDNARPFAPDRFPAGFPKGNGFNAEQLSLVFHSARLVFFHLADENFDGSVDTVVAPLTHPEYPLWVHQYGVLRSSKFDGNVDDEWTFGDRVNEKAGHVPAREGRYIMQNAGKALSGWQWLESGTSLLRYINSAAAQCGFGPGSIVD